MSAKKGGIQTTLPPVSQHQKLAYPLSPLVGKNQNQANPPSPLVRNHILALSNFLSNIHLSGRKCEFGNNLGMCSMDSSVVGAVVQLGQQYSRGSSAVGAVVQSGHQCTMNSRAVRAVVQQTVDRPLTCWEKRQPIANCLTRIHSWQCFVWFNFVIQQTQKIEIGINTCLRSVNHISLRRGLDYNIQRLIKTILNKKKTNINQNLHIYCMKLK